MLAEEENSSDVVACGQGTSKSKAKMCADGGRAWLVVVVYCI
jgi:hypothetical protein